MQTQTMESTRRADSPIRRVATAGKSTTARINSSMDIDLGGVDLESLLFKKAAAAVVNEIDHDAANDGDIVTPRKVKILSIGQVGNMTRAKISRLSSRGSDVILYVIPPRKTMPDNIQRIHSALPDMRFALSEEKRAQLSGVITPTHVL